MAKWMTCHPNGDTMSGTPSVSPNNPLFQTSSNPIRKATVEVDRGQVVGCQNFMEPSGASCKPLVLPRRLFRSWLSVDRAGNSKARSFLHVARDSLSWTSERLRASLRGGRAGKTAPPGKPPMRQHEFPARIYNPDARSSIWIIDPACALVLRSKARGQPASGGDIPPRSWARRGRRGHRARKNATGASRLHSCDLRGARPSCGAGFPA